MWFAVKVLISAVVIAFCSSLAGKKPFLAGFITALPLVSMLALAWAYLEHRDMGKINQYALSIVVAVPLSLTFFLPFLLHRWIKLNFVVTFLSGLLLLYLAYQVHTWLLKH